MHYDARISSLSVEAEGGARVARKVNDDLDKLSDAVGQLRGAVLGKSMAVSEFAARDLGAAADVTRCRIAVEALAFFLHCIDRTAFVTAGPEVRDELLHLIQENILPLGLRVFWKRDDQTPAFLDWLDESSSYAMAQLAEADAEFASQPSLFGDFQMGDLMGRNHAMGRAIARMQAAVGSDQDDFWTYRGLYHYILTMVSGRDPNTQEQLGVHLLQSTREIALGMKRLGA